MDNLSGWSSKSIIRRLELFLLQMIQSCSLEILVENRSSLNDPGNQAEILLCVLVVPLKRCDDAHKIWI